MYGHVATIEEHKVAEGSQASIAFSYQDRNTHWIL
jgi:hypothetical protein